MFKIIFLDMESLKLTWALHAMHYEWWSTNEKHEFILCQKLSSIWIKILKHATWIENFYI
jgi:hypothetical protein